ncbi:MAG: hypothetical protein H0X45_04815 [Planctomycetes bacterium]|nr:hypothetical protein [Planctomycetota bacterium]
MDLLVVPWTETRHPAVPDGLSVVDLPVADPPPAGGAGAGDAGWLTAR